MASKTKNKSDIIVSPAGVASYPYLNRPDTKFNPDGEYKVSLLLPLDEAQVLIDLIDKGIADSFAQAKKDNPKKAKKIKKADPPYSEETNEDGDETGNMKINFKMKARVTPREGQPFTQRPALFDAKGTPLSKNIAIGGGSRIKVAFEAVPFFTDLIGAGITLRMKAVQVLELVEYNGGTAESFGFEEEEGFEASTHESEDQPFGDNDGDGDDEEDF